MNKAIKADFLTGLGKIDCPQEIGGIYGIDILLKREAAIGGKVKNLVRPDGSNCLLHSGSIAKINVMQNNVGCHVVNSPPVCSLAGKDVNLMPLLQKQTGQACT